MLSPVDDAVSVTPAAPPLAWHGVDHLTLPVSGVDAATAFFVTVLGARVEYAEPAGATMIRLASINLKLVEAGTDAEPRSAAIVSVHVDDVDEAARSIQTLAPAARCADRAVDDSGLPVLTVATPWQFAIELVGEYAA